MLNRCSFCCLLGHNKRTCAAFKKKAMEEPDSRTARRYKYMKDKIITKSCHYCHRTGHNKATCKELLKDKISAIKKNQEHRKEVLEKFKQFGIGLGTMISYKHYDSDIPKILLIEKIEWDNILFNHAKPSIIVNSFGQREKKYDLTVDKYFWSLLEKNKILILSKALDECISTDIPDDWLKGGSNIDTAFPF